MKNTVPFTLLFLFSLLTFFACQHGGMRDQLVGNWKMASVKLTSSEQQKQMINTRITALQDSLSHSTDTARQNKFQKQVTVLEQRAADMTAKQDSAIKKTVWEFKSNCDFIANMGSKENKGLWSFDDKLMMLFTVVAKQAYSQRVELDKDSLTIQLDSLNYFKFVRVK